MLGFNVIYKQQNWQSIDSRSRWKKSHFVDCQIYKQTKLTVHKMALFPARAWIDIHCDWFKLRDQSILHVLLTSLLLSIPCYSGWKCWIACISFFEKRSPFMNADNDVTDYWRKHYKGLSKTGHNSGISVTLIERINIHSIKLKGITQQFKLEDTTLIM